MSSGHRCMCVFTHVHSNSKGYNGSVVTTKVKGGTRGDAEW